MKNFTSEAIDFAKNYHAEILLLTWLLLPNLALWFNRETSSAQLLASMLVSLCVFSLPALFVNTRRALFLANLPWALFSGLLAAFTFRYDAPISTGLMQSLLQTNWSEATEQLQRYYFPALFAILAFLGYIFLARRIPAETLKHRKLLSAGALWSVIGFIYLPYIAFEAHHRAGITLNTHFFRQSYPINLLETGYAAIHHHKFRSQSTARAPYAIPPLSGQRKIFVLIIGESTRAHSFDTVGQQHGFFKRFPSLVYFPDTLAQANFTDASVPMLLTGAKTLPSAAQLPSLIEWQNAANCVTAVISNNTSFDITAGAAIRDVVGDSGVTHHSRFDHDMLATVDGLLTSTAPRHLCLILHTVGSHFDYAARYKKEFSLYPVVGTEQQRLTAAYQNSVVMVQDFIARVIERLSRTEAESFMVYTSDHGENLLEIDGLREHVTNRPTEFELKVPLLFWANKSYLDNNRLKWEQLSNNRLLPVSNREVLPTLLDAMDFPPQSFGHGSSLMRPFVPTERFFVHPDHSLRSEKTMLKFGNNAAR